LAKKPNDISVLDVIRAIDGEKSIFDCKEIRQRMDVFSNEVPMWACKGMCGIHTVMRKAQLQMEKELGKHSISMLSQQMYAKSHSSFPIEVKEWLGARRGGDAEYTTR